MKIWIVEREIMTTYDEYIPQSFSTEVEKIFDTKDKAISYVREQIKNAIDGQIDKSYRHIEANLDHVPTDEEIFEPCGCWYMTTGRFRKDQFSYYVREYNVE